MCMVIIKPIPPPGWLPPFSWLPPGQELCTPDILQTNSNLDWPHSTSWWTSLGLLSLYINSTPCKMLTLPYYLLCKSIALFIAIHFGVHQWACLLWTTQTLLCPCLDLFVNIFMFKVYQRSQTIIWADTLQTVTGAAPAIFGLVLIHYLYADRARGGPCKLCYNMSWPFLIMWVHG